jgi:Domain of unknown function (DUF4398)
MVRRRVLLFSILLPASLIIACGEPPNKELHQAQGAIDAARAVGAAVYAPDELTGAVDALTRAQEAVAQRDYRLALNYALDSRERAQAAAKRAADERATARSDAERLLADTTAAIAVATVRLKAAEDADTPAQGTATLRAAIETARRATDDAGNALAKEDYLGARQRLQGVSRAIAAAVVSVPPPPSSAPPARPTRAPRRPR